MSFSASFPEWSLFAEREEVKLDVDLISPAAAMAALLQFQQQALQEVRRAGENEHMAWVRAIAALAVQVGRIEMLLSNYSAASAALSEERGGQTPLVKFYRSVRIVKDQMIELLRNHGIEIMIPLGKTYEEVANNVQIDSWKYHADYTVEVIAEVLEAGVVVRGEVVQQARVIMGAPLDVGESGAQTRDIQ